MFWRIALFCLIVDLKLAESDIFGGGDGRFDFLSFSFIWKEKVVKFKDLLLLLHPVLICCYLL